MLEGQHFQLDLLRLENAIACSLARRLFPPLDYWVGRGLAHLFLALQMEGASSEGLDAACNDLDRLRGGISRKQARSNRKRRNRKQESAGKDTQRQA